LTLDDLKGQYCNSASLATAGLSCIILVYIISWTMLSYLSYLSTRSTQYRLTQIVVDYRAWPNPHIKSASVASSIYRIRNPSSI